MNKNPSNVKPVTRCDWCVGIEIYEQYHDNEWGMPVHDEQKHFEFLLLESMQAGLSWITILRKRENYRQAFANFDPNIIANSFDQCKVEELMQNEGIIRNRKKIEAAINNAKCFLNIQQQYESFDKFIWSFTNGQVIQNHWDNLNQLPATSKLSDQVAKSLKQAGFKFVGSTTIYAHLQAIGVINDHLTSCFRYTEQKP